MATKCSSQFAQSRSPSASPNSLDHGLPVYLGVHSNLVANSISKLARSWPQSAALSSLDLGRQVHVQTQLVTATQCISEFTLSQSPIASPNSLDHGLGVYFGVVESYLSTQIDTKMRIQPEYMSFQNNCTIISSYEFHAHSQRSERCYFF